MFEHAPLLVALLAPYPDMRIVLSTSWVRVLGSMRKVARRLPPVLRARVVGATVHGDMEPDLFASMPRGTQKGQIAAAKLRDPRIRCERHSHECVPRAQETGQCSSALRLEAGGDRALVQSITSLCIPQQARCGLRATGGIKRRKMDSSAGSFAILSLGNDFRITLAMRIGQVFLEARVSTRCCPTAMT